MSLRGSRSARRSPSSSIGHSTRTRWTTGCSPSSPMSPARWRWSRRRVRPAWPSPACGCSASCRRPRCRRTRPTLSPWPPDLVGTDGAALAEPITWRFTTGAPLASLSNQIVFLSDRSGIDNLWAMNPDGTGQRQLSSELSPITMYAVAPDGRRLIVGDGARLVMQQADGGARQTLTAGRRAGDRSRLLAGRRADRVRPRRPGDRRRAGALDQAGRGRRRQPGRAAERAVACHAHARLRRRGARAGAGPARTALLAGRRRPRLRRHERPRRRAGAAGRPAHHRAASRR